MSYVWVMIGSALGGVLRYAITRLTLTLSAGFPFGTILINIAGSFVIGYFGALTLHGGRYSVSDNTRLFVMVGICGGFTTFSSFSLQTFDLLRNGAWGRAMANIVVSVVICVAATALGHAAGQKQLANAAIAQSERAG